ncbi:hypothetical protein EDB86DRAFT_2831802 [Lactarius hatsudake]|nr:hypothetical protein EDB86DRAFT_2831802 [Lactarius hatsudake]
MTPQRIFSFYLGLHRLETGDIQRDAAFHRHQHLAADLTRYDAVFPAHRGRCGVKQRRRRTAANLPLPLPKVCQHMANGHHPPEPEQVVLVDLLGAGVEAGLLRKAVTPSPRERDTEAIGNLGQGRGGPFLTVHTPCSPALNDSYDSDSSEVPADASAGVGAVAGLTRRLMSDTVLARDASRMFYAWQMQLTSGAAEAEADGSEVDQSGVVVTYRARAGGGSRVAESSAAEGERCGAESRDNRHEAQIEYWSLECCSGNLTELVTDRQNPPGILPEPVNKIRTPDQTRTGNAEDSRHVRSFILDVRSHTGFTLVGASWARSAIGRALSVYLSYIVSVITSQFCVCVRSLLTRWRYNTGYGPRGSLLAWPSGVFPFISRSISVEDRSRRLPVALIKGVPWPKPGPTASGSGGQEVWMGTPYGHELMTKGEGSEA